MATCGNQCIHSKVANHLSPYPSAAAINACCFPGSNRASRKQQASQWRSSQNSIKRNNHDRDGGQFNEIKPVKKGQPFLNERHLSRILPFKKFQTNLVGRGRKFETWPTKGLQTTHRDKGKFWGIGESKEFWTAPMCKGTVCVIQWDERGWRARIKSF